MGKLLVHITSGPEAQGTMPPRLVQLAFEADRSFTY